MVRACHMTETPRGRWRRWGKERGAKTKMAAAPGSVAAAAAGRRAGRIH